MWNAPILQYTKNRLLLVRQVFEGSAGAVNLHDYRPSKDLF